MKTTSFAGFSRAALSLRLARALFQTHPTALLYYLNPLQDRNDCTKGHP